MKDTGFIELLLSLTNVMEVMRQLHISFVVSSQLSDQS